MKIEAYPPRMKLDLTRPIEFVTDNGDKLMPGIFEHAGYLYAHVIDRAGEIIAECWTADGTVADYTGPIRNTPEKEVRWLCDYSRETAGDWAKTRPPANSIAGTKCIAVIRRTRTMDAEGNPVGLPVYEREDV